MMAYVPSYIHSTWLRSDGRRWGQVPSPNGMIRSMQPPPLIYCSKIWVRKWAVAIRCRGLAAAVILVIALTPDALIAFLCSATSPARRMHTQFRPSVLPQLEENCIHRRAGLNCHWRSHLFIYFLYYFFSLVRGRLLLAIFSSLRAERTNYFQLDGDVRWTYVAVLSWFFALFCCCIALWVLSLSLCVCVYDDDGATSIDRHRREGNRTQKEARKELVL